MSEVTDDSAFLAVAVPSAYLGFVAQDWRLAQLVEQLVHGPNSRRSDPGR
jgi:hypothetical protein